MKSIGSLLGLLRTGEGPVEPTGIAAITIGSSFKNSHFLQTSRRKLSSVLSLISISAENVFIITSPFSCWAGQRLRITRHAGAKRRRGRVACAGSAASPPETVIRMLNAYPCHCPMPLQQASSSRPAVLPRVGCIAWWITCIALMLPISVPTCRVASFAAPKNDLCLE